MVLITIVMTMITKPSYGEIWLVNLNSVVGREQAKIRPCLVVSDDRLNHGHADVSFIIPLTSQNKMIPWHVEVAPPEGGLKKVSYIMCEQMKSVSHLRFSQTSLGYVDQSTMDAVKARIRLLCVL